MDATKRAQEICAQVNGLLVVQSQDVGARGRMTLEAAEAFAIRRRQINALIAELDVLAAISSAE
jgi:hypothetical protein